MQPDQLSDAQLDDLAAHIAPRLPTGTHGDRVILGRRQFAAAMGGTIGAGALMALGVDRATAQAAGNFGTEEEPGNMWAYNLDVANGVTSNLPMGGNDIEDVGSLSIEQATIGQLAAVVWNGTNQPVDHDTFTKFDFNNIEFEDTDVLDVDTSANEITILEGGRYVVTARLRWGASSSWSTGDELLHSLVINGSSEVGIEFGKIGTIREHKIMPPEPLDLSENDAMSIEVRQESGESQELQNFSRQQAAVSIWRVG